MGFAKYLLRFDDAHEAMDFKKWETITSIIIRNKLKPIVAVILNMDEDITYQNKDLARFKNAIEIMESRKVDFCSARSSSHWKILMVVLCAYTISQSLLEKL